MYRHITKYLIALWILALLLAVPASAAGTTEFIIQTDCETYQPGDVITCTVSIGAVEQLYGLKLKVNIPRGMSLVEGSGKVSENLQSTLQAAKVEFVESTGVFIVGACNYSGTDSLLLFRFQCKVDEGTIGTREIFLEIDPENVFDLQYDNIAFTVSGGTVEIEKQCLHDWSDATADGEDGHWYDCRLCDMSRIDAHSDEDSDGCCDACGYGTPMEEKSHGWLILVVIVVAVAALAAAAGGFILWRRKQKKKKKKEVAV